MRKKIASILTRLAVWLNPEAAHEAVIPVFKNYEASAIGTAWAITIGDIKKFQRKKKLRSFGKARKQLISQNVAKQHEAILDKANDLIYSRVYNDGKDIVIESRLNVYAPTKDTK